jgi:hypothetical protein
MARTNGSASHCPTWPEETTTGDVMHYATREVSNALILFLAAERAKDTEQMTLHAKAIRNVATRIDQFRRMRVRQWQAQRELSPKSTFNPAESGT